MVSPIVLSTGEKTCNRRREIGTAGELRWNLGLEALQGEGGDREGVTGEVEGNRRE